MNTKDVVTLSKIFQVYIIDRSTGDKVLAKAGTQGDGSVELYIRK